MDLHLLVQCLTVHGAERLEKFGDSVSFLLTTCFLKAQSPRQVLDYILEFANRWPLKLRTHILEGDVANLRGHLLKPRYRGFVLQCESLEVGNLSVIHCEELLTSLEFEEFRCLPFRLFLE